MTEASSKAESDIDDRIEKRILLLQDRIELRLTKEVDVILKTKFDTIIKIFGWAFSLVAIVFAGFGIKTIIDIREIAETTAKDEVTKKLSIDDPNSEFRRDIDKIVARGIIDSYLITLTKTRQDRFADDIAISENDRRRILRLITDPETSSKDFTDAFEVIIATGRYSRNQNEYISRLIYALASVSGEEYKWIHDQPEKRAALFNLYTSDKLIPVAREILTNKDTSTELKTAAIRYAGNYDSDAGNLLEELASEKNNDISEEALLALARVEPTSEVLKVALEKPETSNRRNDWIDSVRIAVEIAKPSQRSFFDDDPDIDKRLQIAAVALQKAFDNGYFLKLHTRSRRSGAGIGISSRDSPHRSHGISTELIEGAASGALQILLRESASDADQLMTNLRALCLEDGGECRGVVRVNLERGGRIVLQSGVEIDKMQAPAGVALRPATIEKESSITVGWTDANAVPKSGLLASISDAEDAVFTVSSVRALGDSEADY